MKSTAKFKTKPNPYTVAYRMSAELANPRCPNDQFLLNVKVCKIPKIYIIVIEVLCPSIAKLAQLYKSDGKKVLLGAADTFRAAAIEQLQVWGSRLEVDVVALQHGADPGAVVFDSVQAARSRGVHNFSFTDYCGNGKTASHGFGNRHNIRLNARMFDRKHFTGSGKSGLNFITDEQDSMLVTNTA